MWPFGGGHGKPSSGGGGGGNVVITGVSTSDILNVNVTNTVDIDDATPIKTRIEEINPLAELQVILSEITTSDVLNVELVAESLPGDLDVNINNVNGNLPVIVNNVTPIDIDAPNPLPIDDSTPIDINIASAAGPLDANINNVDTQDQDATDMRRLLCDAVVAQDTKATTVIHVETAGASGDQVTISVDGLPDLVITLGAGEAGNEANLGGLIASFWNGSANHNGPWFAWLHKISSDYVTVFIKANSESNFDAVKPDHGDFSIVTTGTTVVNAVFDNIVKRIGPTNTKFDQSKFGDRHIAVNNDYKLPLETSYFVSYLNNGGNIEMNVDGSGTEAVYGYFPVFSHDVYITEMRIHGEDNSINQNDFFNISGGLGNGLRIDYKTQNVTSVLFDLTTTFDMLAKFAYPLSDYFLIREAGSDFLIAGRKFKFPILLRRAGDYTFSDYLVARVRDDLTSITKLRISISGFTKLRVF